MNYSVPASRLAATLLLAAVGSAHASIQRGSQGWVLASSVAEGAAQGLRAATTAEFSAYLTSGGYGSESSTQEFFSRTATDLMGFPSTAYLGTSMPYEYSNPRVTLGWLNGTQDQVGAMLATSGRQQTSCPYDPYNYNCYKTIYVQEAAYGPLTEMLAGQHDRYPYAVGGDWKAGLAAVKQPDGSYNLGYFMLPVPEASTFTLMSLGLLGIGLIAQKRQRA